MEAAVAERFTDAVVAEAAERFGFRPDALRRLGSFESYVFAVDGEGERRVLRLTHSSHRSAGQIEAELDWIRYLDVRGVAVAPPRASTNERFVESVPVDGGAFHATSFAWAPGVRIADANAAELWDEALFRTWGAALGRMHALASRWEPAPGRARRPQWFESDEALLRRLPADDTAALRARDALLARSRARPRLRSSYGLVHHDAHPGNFFVDGERIVLFDFDDAVYDFFAADIAIALYYALWRVPDDETKRDFAHRFLAAFLAGYRREHPELPPGELAHLPLFLRLRDLTLYAAVRTKVDLDALEPEERAEAERWVVPLLAELGSRIEAGEPSVELELERFE